MPCLGCHGSGADRPSYVAGTVYPSAHEPEARARAMLAAQSSGDCNACRTVVGASGAPGRIALP